MINILISLLMVLFGTSTFHLSINLGRVNRIFGSINYGVVEESIHVLNVNDVTKPYYQREAFQESVCLFLDERLEKYVTDFSLSFYYFDIETNKQSFNLYVDGAVINLKASVNHIAKYDKTLTMKLL